MLLGHKTGYFSAFRDIVNVLPLLPSLLRRTSNSRPCSSGPQCSSRQARRGRKDSDDHWRARSHHHSGPGAQQGPPSNFLHLADSGRGRYTAHGTEPRPTRLLLHWTRWRERRVSRGGRNMQGLRDGGLGCLAWLAVIPLAIVSKYVPACVSPCCMFVYVRCCPVIGMQ